MLSEPAAFGFTAFPLTDLFGLVVVGVPLKPFIVPAPKFGPVRICAPTTVLGRGIPPIASAIAHVQHIYRLLPRAFVGHFIGLFVRPINVHHRVA